MRTSHRVLLPAADRGPLRVLFVLTSMPVGGAETLLAGIVRHLDREHFSPEICCLKSPGPLAEELSHEVPVHSRLLANKWDLRVFFRLCQLMRKRRVDALVTVGAGDKMFWGRLAAWWCGVPVICSAIHSTGWPDTIGFLNRRLTGLTDAFIAVASAHAEYLVQREGFPANMVRTIPNGISMDRFQRRLASRQTVRQEFQIPPGSPVIGIVAALRPEKNHVLFLQVAAQIHTSHPDAHFLIVGDGPQRSHLEQLARYLGISTQVHFAGSRADIPDLLSAMDVFVLTSHMEASPVSILEALACQVPVVAPDVGSIAETVIPGKTGFLVRPGDAGDLCARLNQLLTDASLREQMGSSGRDLVAAHGSLEGMVRGYEQLLGGIYEAKVRSPGRGREGDLVGLPSEGAWPRGTADLSH